MKTQTIAAYNQRVVFLTEMLSKCLKKDVARIKKRLENSILDLELALEDEQMNERALL